MTAAFRPHPTEPPPGSAPDRGARGMVIDAEFADLTPAGMPQAAQARAPEAPDRSASLSGMGVLRPERPAPAAAPFSRRGGFGFWCGGLLLAALAFWESGGHAWLLPQRPVPARGAPAFALALLGSQTEYRNGRPVLRVEAEARNRQAGIRALPPLSILITTGKGGALRYRLAAPAEGIGPGGRQRFSTSLPVPADGVRAVSVAFTQ